VTTDRKSRKLPLTQLITLSESSNNLFLSPRNNDSEATENVSQYRSIKPVLIPPNSKYLK